MYVTFSFGFEGEMCDLVVLIPEHYLSITLSQNTATHEDKYEFEN